MPRFLIEREKISESKVIISGSDFKHIRKVLRLGIGSNLDLFDINSTEYSGEIIEVNSNDIVVQIKNSWKIQTESNIQIDLYQSIIKPGKMDLIVQKATELGVSNVIPIITKRTQRGLRAKTVRLNKIAIESAKQCKRSKPPTVSETINLKEALATDNKYDLKIIFYEISEKPFKNFIDEYSGDINKVSVVIGPEGGFSENEIILAEKHGYIAAGLGNRILRAETAAISTISLLQFQFGDLG